MKIWITHNGVGSLTSGGLERCRVWFHKPIYIHLDTKHEYHQLPFGGGDESMGLEEFGWRANRYFQNNDGGVKERSSLSLGDWLGYSDDSPISCKVWEELCKHFQSNDLRFWIDQSKKLNLKRSDFLMELEIDIKLID